MENFTTDMVLFRQKRQEIALVYDLYFDYISQEISKGNHYIPDRFTLTTAFSVVFYDTQVVSGLCGFTPTVNSTSGRIVLRFLPHHWLSWRDENNIIDVIPLDGVFGVSVPQAILQQRNRARFFPAMSVYPRSWDSKKKVDFDNKVNEVVAVLEELMKKIPC